MDKVGYILFKVGKPMLQLVDGVERVVDTGDVWVAVESTCTDMVRSEGRIVVMPAVKEKRVKGRKVDCEAWIKERSKIAKLNNNNL